MYKQNRNIMKEKFASQYPFYDIPGPIAIAHRGGDAAGAEKENSMAAFESANKAGIIYAETDTILSKDGKVLAFHGKENKKDVKKFGSEILEIIHTIAGLDGKEIRDRLQSMTYGEIKIKIRTGGEIVPTLEEVLIAFPEMRFFIDPKSKEVIVPLVNLIKKIKAQDRVSIGAFGYDRAKEVAELLGGQRNICTSLGNLESIMILGLGLRLTSPLVKSYFNRTGATSLQVPHNIVSTKMIERAHELGIHVIVWPLRPKTDDNRAYMEKALDQGVHGLMSDHTYELKEAVLARDPQNASIRRNLKDIDDIIK